MSRIRTLDHRATTQNGCRHTGRIALWSLLLLVMSAAFTEAAAQGRDRHARPPQGIDLVTLKGLTAHTGVRFDPAKLRRRPFAVVFGFTHCPDVCPTTLLHMKTLLDDLGPKAKSFPVLFVTVDPDRDTVDVLRQYVTSFDERTIGLTGNALDIEAVSHAFNAFYEKQAPSGSGYSVDHTTRVYLIDAYGLLAGAHDPATESKEMRSALVKLLNQ